MIDRPLPAPATQVDEYLFDIAMSLRQINGALAQLVAVDAELPGDATIDDLTPIPLREPGQRKRRK